MPKRTDIHSVLIIGAGPIIIGQACEFDYSGTQAVKALKEEGYRVILVNSNPATIMTDPGLADTTYVEPIEPATLAKVVERERPDAILPTMGGQTGLNTALALWRDGTLARLGVEMIGARADVIEKAEDRWQFRAAMESVGLKSPRARIVRAYEDAMAAREHVGVPAIIRPSYTLGGTGGGIAYNDDEYEEVVRSGLRASPAHEILIEQSVLGWKEFEMEVVRDNADNCIIVCAIENVDPMGVHTGDSVTVAPSLTLTDKEYQIMRDASIACLREIGVDTGGSNVQFAVNPETGEMVVIEMNPRVSRSSALASKATGFPIARVAAKLAVGYTLDELTNDITRVTPASFEPTIDYVVTKLPRFTFEKFPGASATLTTSMKAVGEAMSIGRSFPESLQKGLRSLETGLTGLDPVTIEGAVDRNGAVDSEAICGAVAEQVPDRLLRVAQAFRHGMSVEAVQRASRIDPWFLRQIEHLVRTEADVRAHGLPDDRRSMLRLKTLGFADARLAALTGLSAGDVAEHRRALGVRPVYKRVDTCAGEFPAPTPYMYGAYEGDGVTPAADEADPGETAKILILGGGPNRIGQGIEFDYCCVHACYALRDAGFETIMVNCNPETVSTDYDTADRLYFEPLTAEDVVELATTERAAGRLAGAIVQFGGQTPLKLAGDLEAAGIPILGTPPDAIDRAEDRERFQALLHTLDLKQPANGLARSEAEAARESERIGYPVLLRPSYVLGGRAMEIAHTPEDLHRYIRSAVTVSGRNPVLIDSYLADAVEVDVDAFADGERVFVAGIMEHIEEAGIHSGDSACALPPYQLNADTIAELERQTREIALELGVVGLMNIQFAVHGLDIYILEVNPRASRTVPFVAKASGVPIAKIAAHVMAGASLDQFRLTRTKRDHIAVKEAVFPFSRFPGVDVILGPEMKSTGEVMGIDNDFARAFAKAQIGAGVKLPYSGTVFISVKDRDKPAMVALARELHDMGFSIVATGGTADHLAAADLPVTRVNKVREGRPHVLDSMKSGEIDLVFNTTEGARAVADSFSLRRTALTNGIPYYTTVDGCMAVTRAIQALAGGRLEVAPLQSYFEGSF